MYLALSQTATYPEFENLFNEISISETIYYNTHAAVTIKSILLTYYISVPPIYLRTI